MSHPVNDMIMDEILDKVADMSAHEKHMYLFKNGLQAAYRENWNDVIMEDMLEKRMEQSV